MEIPGLNQILDFQRYTCKQLGVTPSLTGLNKSMTSNMDYGHALLFISQGYVLCLMPPLLSSGLYYEAKLCFYL